MAVRMLCTGCWRTARPDTRIEGSDRLERLAWCLLGVPGLAYCWWRHTTRRKVCPACGGGELVREARACRRLRPPAGAGLSLVHAAEPDLWPSALRTPRDRLRYGSGVLGLGLALATLAACATLGALPAPAGEALGLLVAGAWGLAAAGLLARDERRRPLRPAEAWDAQGRRIPIEAF